MALKPSIFLPFILCLAACDPVSKNDPIKTGETPPISKNETSSNTPDSKIITQNKKLIDFLLKDAPYLALVQTKDIKRTSIWADDIGQMQELDVHLDILETFRGTPEKTIKYVKSTEMEPLSAVPEIDPTPHIISLCYSNGKYSAQEVAFSIEAYPELIAYAREQAKTDPAIDRTYPNCPS